MKKSDIETLIEKLDRKIEALKAQSAIVVGHRSLLDKELHSLHTPQK